MKRSAWLLFTCGAAMSAWAQQGVNNATGGAKKSITVSFVCEAVYQPSRATWTRTIVVAYDQRQVRTVTIDGQAVYSFAIRHSAILTALDNERITFDAQALTWSSDFRGLATGQGRCERHE